MAISGVTSSSFPSADRDSLSTQREASQDRLQSVFTAVLHQAGREGYVSAEPLADDTNLPQEIGASWYEWFNEAKSSRYTFQAGADSPSVQAGKSADDVQRDYQAILLDAYNSGGYANPEQYLRSLTKEQLRTVQQVHHLAEPIDPSKLSTEGSLNLLLPPGAQVDEDHNGLTAVGAALMIGFPNSNTPKDVRRAWEAATANMPEQDRMTYELQMMMPILTANMKVDENGQFVRSVQPGDADWVNPMNSADYSYIDAANQWLDYLDRFRYQMPVEQYARDKTFWSSFREHLTKN